MRMFLDYAHRSPYTGPMARLNISLPDELYETAKKWRGTKNLSQICARALEDELRAAEASRSGKGLFAPLRPPSEIERRLVSRFALAEAHVAAHPGPSGDLRDAIGQRAADFLNRRICDDALLAVGGGRQMWHMVHNLSPRSVRAALSAFGFHSNDPSVLHVHPNTLVTLLWLLYSPGARAQLIGASFTDLWSADLPERDRPSYFVMASCAAFSPRSPFADLLGERLTGDLLARRAAGDFAYIFFDAAGSLIDPPGEPAVDQPDCSLFSARMLQTLSARADARVVVAAGGADKLPALRAALANQLCNVVVTDAHTAAALLDPPRQSGRDRSKASPST